MALINENNKYIKLSADGSFIFYNSKEDRERQKQAPDSSVIINKYKEIISQKENELVSFGKKNNLLTYDPDSDIVKNRALKQGGVYSTYYYLNNELNKWSEEYNKYIYNLQINNSNGNYPLIKTIFPDVKDSIASIEFSGAIPVNTNSISEIYDQVKQENRFGKTIDA